MNQMKKVRMKMYVAVMELIIYMLYLIMLVKLRKLVIGFVILKMLEVNGGD